MRPIVKSILVSTVLGLLCFLMLALGTFLNVPMIIFEGQVWTPMQKLAEGLLAGSTILFCVWHLPSSACLVAVEIGIELKWNSWIIGALAILATFSVVMQLWIGAWYIRLISRLIGRK